jgi:hypothetical protein
LVAVKLWAVRWNRGAAQDAFQLARRPVDRGLRHAKRACRRGKRAVLGDGQKRPHLRPAELAFDGAQMRGTDTRDPDAELCQRLLELAEQPGRAALQDAAGFGQITAGVAPAKQRSSDLVLEAGDGLGDRRLGHVDRGGRPADILGARDGFEYEQLTEARDGR